MTSPGLPLEGIKPVCLNSSLQRIILKSPIRIMGVAPGIWDPGAALLIERYANQAAEALELPVRISAEEVYNTAEYVGRGYGVPTPEGVEAIKLLAR